MKFSAMKSISSHLIRRRKTLDHGTLPVRGGVGLGVRRDAAELEHVLGLLLAEDVHGIVVGDDPDEPAGGVDDRQGEQVVLVDLTGDGLLVLVHPGEDHVALHDVFDRGRAAREDQVLQRDEADQLAIVVHDVAVVDRLAIGGLVAEPLEGLADRDVRRQGDVVGGHEGAGGPRLVARQPADVVAFGLGEVGQHDVHELLVEPLHQVGPLVVRHVVQELGRLGVGHGLDDPVLALGVQVAEDLGPIPRQEDAEEGVAVPGFQVLDQLGDPPRVLVLDEFAQRGHLSALDQFAQVGHQERISHGPSFATLRACR